MRSRIDSSGVITTIAGTGTGGYNGDGGAATSAQLNGPKGVAIDGSGRVLIADTLNSRIRRIETNGTISTVTGDGSAFFSGDTGDAASATVNAPEGVAVDSTGRILIADSGNVRIRRIETDNKIYTIAGGGAGGSGDGGAAVDALLAAPIRVVPLQAGGFLLLETDYLAGYGTARIRRVDATGKIFTIAGAIDPITPGAAANALLPDPRQVARTTDTTFVAGGSSGTVAMVRNGRVDIVAGRYRLLGETGNLARFRRGGGSVNGVAFDVASNTLWYSEARENSSLLDHVIHKVTLVDPASPLTWTEESYAGANASFIDGARSSARFSSPAGLWLVGQTLYVADSGNHAIRAIDVASGTVSTAINSAHALGFAGDGGPAAQARLNRPTAITSCPNGDLFIADTGNARVRRVDTAKVITTVIGTGLSASGGNAAMASSSPIDDPIGLSCDAAGNLFVSSTTTLRLLPASSTGIVDGTGPVFTIYGVGSSFPGSSVTCLTAVASTGPDSVQVADACTGFLVELTRQRGP